MVVVAVSYKGNQMQLMLLCAYALLPHKHSPRLDHCTVHMGS